MKQIASALHTRAGLIAAIVLGLVLVIAIIGPAIAPFDPVKNTAAILQPPSTTHWFGTDYLGRDVLSRVLAGAPLSVFTALEAVGIGLVIGVIPGITSVYLGRAYEWITLRVMDGLIALPFLIFAIAVAALLGNAVQQAMIAVGILIAPSFYRITRAAVLSHANAQYVTASQLFGASLFRVIRTHVWSKILPTLVVATANATAAGLLIVSSLTFLGIGVVPPDPTWGGILASDLSYLSQAPYGPIFPSLLIMATVGALNLLADAIKDTSGDHGRVQLLRRRDRRVSTS
ncbi:ABC transporter permease [Rathayibacter sp. CAU 1779]